MAKSRYTPTGTSRSDWQNGPNGNWRQNLRQDFTTEERAANGRKAAEKAKETKRRQKTFRESVKAIMECRPLDEEQCALLEEMGLDQTYLNQIQLAVFNKAANGDVEAARYLRDTAGEKPRDGVDLDIESKPIAALDMSKLTDDQLRALAAKRADD